MQMKKRIQGLIIFITGLVLGAALFTGITVFAANSRNYQAQAATFPIYINGEEWETDSPVVVIDGRTYLPLKALGDVLGADVKWNEKLFRVDISKPEEIFVISEQGGKYHRPNCTTVKIIKQRLTRNEAEEMGYTACAVCQP